jgi:hypothetical protein
MPDRRPTSSLVLYMQFPVWCACGKLVTFPNESRCEDCYANDMARLKIKGCRPYAERGNPPEPDNTYEKLLAREEEHDRLTGQTLRRSIRH